MTRLRKFRTRRAGPLMAAAGAAMLLAMGAAATETPRAEASEGPRQIAENPAPRGEASPERQSEPSAEQFAEGAGRAGYQYWIQVGSHKDEAIARVEWQKIQGAAQGVAVNAGNRIQRADLGARGVYYRIQVGPFASSGEAAQFCAQLKARQIDCFLAAPEATTAATPPPEPAPRKAVAPPSAPKPIAKPAEPKPEPKPVAKPAEAKPAAKPAEPKPVAKPGEPRAAPAEKPKDAAAMPKTPAEAPALPEPKPPRSASAEKPDAPLSTAPGLPGVLD